MLTRWRSQLRFYGLAVLADALALLLTWLLQPWIKPTVFALFYPAVMVSSSYGGLKPGLVSVILAALSIKYFFLEPVYSLAFISSVTFFQFSLLITVAVMICLLSTGLRAAQQRTEASLNRLRSSEEQYRRIVETANEGIWLIDADARITYVNSQMAQMLSYTPVEMLGHSTFEFIYNSDRAEAERRFERQTHGSEEDSDLRLCRKDGSPVSILSRTRPILSDSGEFQGVLGLVTDITERKQALEALRASNQRLTNILENMSDAFVSLDQDWRIVYQNAAAERINAKPRSEVMGKTHWEEWPASVGTNVERQYRRAMTEQIPVHFDHRYYSPPDYDVWLEIHAYPSEDGLAIFFRDITERKQAEAALRQSESRFRVMAETIQDVFWITDFRLPQVLYVSPAYEQIWGRSRDELYHNYTTWLETIHPEDRERAQAIAATCRYEDFVENEYRIVRSDGSIRWIRDRGFAIRDEAGQIYQVVGVAQDVTDHKLATEGLKHSEAKFRRLVEASLFGVAMGDFSGRMLYANDALLNMIGYTREELETGQIRWTDLTPPEYLDLDWQAGEELRQHGICKPIEKEYIHKNGHRVPILIGAALLEEPYEEQEEIIAFYIDLTELKQTETTLREQQLLLKTILKQAADAVIVCDATGKLTFVNAVARRLAHQDSDDSMFGMNLLDWGEAFDANGQLIPLEDHAMSKALRGEASYAVESRMVRGDGSFYDILISAAPLINHGQIIGAVGTFIDITERKQVEEALRESAERLNLALVAASMGDWSWDATTDVVTFSERAATIFGIPPGPYMTWTQIQELVHEEDRDRARLQVEQAILEQSNYDIEYRVIRPDGVQCWVSAKGLAQYDASGRVLGMLGVVQDITERKYAEQALQESEAIARARAQELEALMEITPAALWIAHDPNCHYMSANQTAYDLMRATPSSVATATPPDGSYPLQFKQCRKGQDIAPHDLPMQKAIRTEQEVRDEVEFVFEDGTVRFIYGKAVPLRNEMGSVRGAIGAFVDITERKHAEREREQLLAREQAAREEAEAANRIKDEFLAVLSHELRSPLNPILGWAKLLRSRNFDETTTARALETIERNANVQIQLIEDLLDVSRILRGKLSLNISSVNLASTIEAAIETVRLAAQAKSIQINSEIDSTDCIVSGDSSRLQQVVWNLLSNAVKFTPTEGRVTVRLKYMGTDAQIQVSDTGKGIQPDFLPYVFDYFRQEDSATTRKFGGLGLGLAIVRRMVELHGGSVKADSSGEGMGATFTVTLPLIRTVPETSSNQRAPENASSLENVRVLVVDDDADTLELLAFILSQYGAQVRAVAKALEALEVLREWQPDLLVSDIGMPEVDGYMLIRQIRALPPEQGGEIPAIAVTAYAGETDHRQVLAAGFHKHVTKPVEPAELAFAIANLLTETASRNTQNH